MKLTSSTSTLLLALSGLGLWTFAGGQLSALGSFHASANPLGIQGSPYGQTLAMALQAPIDRDWHGGIEIHQAHSQPDGDHHHCDHPGCQGHHKEQQATDQVGLIERLESLVTTRTNPRPPTPAHQLYLRGEIESKLRFAYQLDPSHYGNYSAYHHFLIQDDLSTMAGDHSTRITLATSLARQTIANGLAEETDPRPALTAAAAAYNLLELSLSAASPARNPEDLRQQLEALDLCLSRHAALFDESLRNGFFGRLSPLRQEEMITRGTFLKKLRDAAAKSIDSQLRLQTSQH